MPSLDNFAIAAAAKGRSTIVEDAADGLAAMIVGAYVIAVLVNGNSSKLISMLSEEIGFLEFVAAIAIIKVIVDNDRTGLSYPLAMAAGFAVLLNASGKTNIVGIMDEFSSGHIGLFEAFAKLFGK